MVVLIIKFGSIINAIGQFLIVDEAPQKSDVIIILGGYDTTRVAYGAKLYQLGYADKVLLSGSGMGMTKQAVSLGIPESAILQENQSTTTFENAKYSLKIVQNLGYKSAIVVTTSFHTRRTSIIFAQFFKGIDVKICPVPYDSAITHNWWKDTYDTQFVVSEYAKLVYHYLFEWNLR